MGADPKVQRVYEVEGGRRDKFQFARLWCQKKKKKQQTNSRVIKQTIREDKSRESLMKRALKLLQLIV